MNRDLVIRRIALGLVILSATVLSYSTLQARAVHIGLPEWSSWFYPLIFDAFILGASRMWTNTELSEGTRTLAMGSTLLAIGAAIAAFIAEFWDQGLVAVLFACAIPAVLALSLVLTSRSAADRARPYEMTQAELEAEFREMATELPDWSSYPRVTLHSTEPGVLTNSEPVTVSFNEMPEVTVKEVHLFDDPTPDEKRAWIREQLASGVDLTGAMVDRHFGSPRNGNRLLKEVRNSGS